MGGVGDCATRGRGAQRGGLSGGRGASTVAVAAMITTSPSLEALRGDIAKGCDLRDLAGCERYVSKVSEGLRGAFDEAAKGVLTEAQFEPGGKLPTGYIQGYIDAQGIP